MTQDSFERQLNYLQPERRQAIGSWIVGISYMKELGSYIANVDKVNTTIDQINGSTKVFLAMVREEEFRAIRHKLTVIEPESEAHIARWRMGIAGKTQKNSLGNRYFAVNKDFIVATYYHEDSEIRQKINADISVDQMIDGESQQFVDFYLSRSKVQLETEGQDVKLPDLINDTRQDIEYWLSQST